MKDLYIIGGLKPLSKAETQKIEDSVNYSLPIDYIDFLAQFGYGEINELLTIVEPDKGFIRNNFSDFMDFWDWQAVNEQKALDGLTIGKTIDGDIIAVMDDLNAPIIMLPRHSEIPVSFPDFESVIDYYNTHYKFENNLYFDTYNQHQLKYISLVHEGKVDKDLIDYLHKSFLQEYKVDKGFNLEVQPKYVIQNIGGWVYFDLVNSSAIRIKYQQQFEEKAFEIIELFTTKQKDYLK